MINLLPPQQKQELLDQERLRLVLILGTLFLLFLLSLSLTLLLVDNYFALTLGDQEILFEEKEKTASFNADLEQEIVQANASFSDLSSFYEKQHDLTGALEKIYGAFPGGTYLRNFSFSFVDQQKGTQIIRKARVTLTGICPTRELLLLLKENLERQEGFSDIYFSPNSWIDAVEPTFNITFYLD